MTCVLVTSLGWVLQFSLGVVAFLVLVLKRYKESPRRPWKVWGYDTSKQAIVSLEIHFINVALARFMMEKGHTHDSCTWYFTMVLLDSSIGLVSVYYLLRWTESFVRRHSIEILMSGEYGTPPTWKPWFAQLLVYNTVMLIEKGLVSLLLLLHFVQQIGGAILKPIGNVSPTFELVLALVITPFLINVMWFWIVDNFLMKGEGMTGQHSSYKFSTLRKQLGEPGSPRSPTSRSSFGSSNLERLLADDDDEESESGSDADELVFASPRGATRRH
eukprot:m.7651 g.7651  ORF g.7651 m.7651 type:complete len:273 (-) comp2465_c0_seq2:25-843(-)